MATLLQLDGPMAAEESDIDLIDASDIWQTLSPGCVRSAKRAAAIYIVKIRS